MNAQRGRLGFLLTRLRHQLGGMRPRLQYKLGLTFIFSFIIPIVVFGLFLLVSFNRILANNLYSYQESSINQLKDELDKYLIDLHRIARSLSYNIPFTIELARPAGSFTAASEGRLQQEKITDHLDSITAGEPSILGYYLLTDQADHYHSASLSGIDDSSLVIPRDVQTLLQQGQQSIALLKARQDYLLDRSMWSVLLFASTIKITYLDQKRMGNGLLVLFIDRGYIDGIIQRHSRSSDQIYLFSDDGSHIYSSDPAVSYKSLPIQLVKELGDSRNGRYKLRGGNQTYLISFVTSRFNSLKLLSFTSESRIRNDIFFLSKFTIIFLVILLLLFLLFTIHLSRSISQPINRLEKIMNRLEESNYRNTADLLVRRNRGILSPYFDHLYSFLHSVIMKINEYHRREKEHELMILQSQINPHFVYNTLNTIRIMAEMDGQESLAKAIRSLIHLLKNSIKIGVIFISIREEVAQIKDYISLQQLRYNNAFLVEYDIDERVYDFKCIKFILQPLVENAIFHGIDTSTTTGHIRISVQKQGPEIAYRIEDNGKGMDSAQLEGIRHAVPAEGAAEKIGIQNVNSRLATYFGEKHTLHIQSEIGKGTSVSYIIPAEPYERPE